MARSKKQNKGKGKASDTSGPSIDGLYNYNFALEETLKDPEQVAEFDSQFKPELRTSLLNANQEYLDKLDEMMEHYHITERKHRNAFLKLAGAKLVDVRTPTTKKGRNGFHIYQSEEWAKATSDGGPQMSSKSFTKMLGRQWKALPDNFKAPYKERARNSHIASVLAGKTFQKVRTQWRRNFLKSLNKWETMMHGCGFDFVTLLVDSTNFDAINYIAGTNKGRTYNKFVLDRCNYGAATLANFARIQRLQNQVAMGTAFHEEGVLHATWIEDENSRNALIAQATSVKTRSKAVFNTLLSTKPLVNEQAVESQAGPSTTNDAPPDSNSNIDPRLLSSPSRGEGYGANRSFSAGPSRGEGYGANRSFSAGPSGEKAERKPSPFELRKQYVKDRLKDIWNAAVPRKYRALNNMKRQADAEKILAQEELYWDIGTLGPGSVEITVDDLFGYQNSAPIIKALADLLDKDLISIQKKSALDDDFGF
ncbi:hypothetical protein BJ508DRAFT_309646 [Ascobolus immersus RN42]|uniref:HMG box domain-containing protein n=1 Tax=Ascobolus immersus RN42 TaxID=1160509 RepID=A0A3N4I1D2_ASCIM|nr:hypothetical protein BJ508DRAFT_309646 [Ascobolus immersus RN42]